MIGAISPQLKPFERLVPTPISLEDLDAKWEAEHPTLTPQQAFASNAELGPPSGSGADDNQASKIHTEIKVNGKVIARTYNSGGIEIADEYRFLSEELKPSFAADRKVGPELAEDRANRFKAALVVHGMIDGDAQPSNPLDMTPTTSPVVELLKAAAAKNQDEWLGGKAKEGPLPGAYFSREA